MYDYLEEMRKDVKQYLEDNFEYKYSDVESIGELIERLNDDLWTEDSVTGNASGSYTFDRALAKEYVMDNIDGCREALSEFCVSAAEIGEKFLNEEWEYLDVTIRCYLLGQVILDLLLDAKDDFEAWLESKEAEEE